MPRKNSNTEWIAPQPWDSKQIDKLMRELNPKRFKEAQAEKELARKRQHWNDRAKK